MSNIGWDFNNYIVLVTGGGSGIGLKIAEEFAKSGATVVIMGRNEKKLQRAVEELNFGLFRYMICDVSNEEQVINVFSQVKEEFGTIDILVNGAGNFTFSNSEEESISSWKESLDNNLTSAFITSKNVFKYMKEEQRGKIINIASLLSFTAFPERAAYSSSKAGIVQLTKTLGIEWIKFGINVNCVAPGMIEIGRKHPVKNLNNEKINDRIPYGKRGTTEDVSNAVLFLASENSNYIVGQSIVVDGGWLAYGYI